MYHQEGEEFLSTHMHEIRVIQHGTTQTFRKAALALSCNMGLGLTRRVCVKVQDVGGINSATYPYS